MWAGEVIIPSIITFKERWTSHFTDWMLHEQELGELEVFLLSHVHLGIGC